MMRQLLNSIYVFSVTACFCGQPLFADITFLNSIRSSFRSPAGVAVTPTDDLFVADLMNQSVKKIEANGTLQRSFFVTTPRDVVVSPVLVVSPTGTSRPVFVVDRDNHQIRRFSDTGMSQVNFGSLGTGMGQFNQPLGIGINTLGDVFVADTGNHRIQRFDINGTFQAAFGTFGTQSGQFNSPTDVAVSTRGAIFVADRNNNRVQKFDNGGNFEFTLSGFDDPTSLALSAADHLYVVDRDNHRIQRFGIDGSFQATFGSQGSGDQQFNQPLGIDVSPKGQIYIADTNNNRVSRYFDSDAWVLGRNEFVQTQAGPIDVGIGSRSFFTAELFRRVFMGLSFDLDTPKALVVGRNTRIANDGLLTISGGTLITDTLQVDGLLRFESGRLEINRQGIVLGADGPFGNQLSVGVDSVIKLGDAVIVGAARDSRMSISNGGVVENTTGTIAPTANTVSGVTVDGFGSMWTNSGALVVGDTGRGGLTIANGGRVRNSSAVLGSRALSAGTVSVSGFSSSWSSSGDVAVGAAGNGLLSIQEGALVENNAATIGSAAGIGNVVLEGAGSRWTSVGSLTVGSGASPTGGRGHLNIGRSTFVSVGRDMSVTANGTVNVDGSLRITGAASVADRGAWDVSLGDVMADRFDVRAGGLLSINRANMTLTGVLNNAGDMQLVGGLASQITASRIVNSGLLRGGARIRATLENAQSGEIRLHVGDQLVVSGAGNVNNGRMNLHSGAIEFTASFQNNASGSVIGRGSLRADGGTTNRGLMTFSGGQTDVRGDFVNAGVDALVLSTGGGTTTFFHRVTNQGGEIRVSEGSSIVFLNSFNGGTTGEGQAIVEGVLSPGNSPAQVRFAGDLVLTPRSATVLELGGSQPGQEHDQILVGSTMTLGGTAHLQPLGDYQGPSDRGQIERFLLLSADQGREGVFHEVRYGEMTLEPTLVLDDGSFQNHAGDGLFRTISYTDRTFELTEYLALGGDADGDFRVQFNDFLTLSANFGMRGDWTDGDFDGNNFVQFPDYLVLATNFGKSAGPPAVAIPEPSTASLCLTISCALAIVLRRVRTEVAT